MANGHGGARPGAGRKRKNTEQYQIHMREIMLGVVTPERWQRVCEVALSCAEDGNKDARAWLAPWVVGAVPQEVKHIGDADNPIEMRVTVARDIRAHDTSTGET